jgi:hypothetical protein
MSTKTMTGRKKGKAAISSEKKNAEAASEYVGHLEDPTTTTEPEGQRLGRVLKAHGGGRLEVQFSDGTTEKPTIAKKIRFHGRAATKGDQSNCMSVGDLVIVDGGFIFGKLNFLQIDRVEAVYNRKHREYPQGFFAKTGAEEVEVDNVVEWDREGGNEGSGNGEEGNGEEGNGNTNVVNMKDSESESESEEKVKWTGRRGAIAPREGREGRKEDGEIDVDAI